MRKETEFYYLENASTEVIKGDRITVTIHYGDWKLKPDAYRNGYGVTPGRWIEE